MEYASKGSEIKIGFETTVKKGKSYEKHYVLTSIQDQGIGIPEDELELIFDKFTQSSRTKTAAGGIGMGLAICKEIIDAHRGKIWAENNSDVGCTIKFLIPSLKGQ